MMNIGYDDDDYDDSYLLTFESINQCISFNKIVNNEIEDYLKGQISNCTCSSTITGYQYQYTKDNESSNSTSYSSSNISSSSNHGSSTSNGSQGGRNYTINKNVKNITEKSCNSNSDCNISNYNEYKICYNYECINYSTQTECIDCNDKYCYNQRFKKQEYANLIVKHTLRKGFGLFANEDVKKNQFLMEYVGK